jgi:CheY-like chemotaxis protein
MKILVLDDDQYRLDIFKRNIDQGLITSQVDYVKTAHDAIECLQATADYNYVFLDHDLGGQQMEWQEENCGMQVVDWIIANNYRKNVSIIIHSWNIPRAKEMCLRLTDAGYPAVQMPGAWNIVGH